VRPFSIANLRVDKTPRIAAPASGGQLRPTKTGAQLPYSSKINGRRHVYVARVLVCLLKERMMNQEYAEQTSQMLECEVKGKSQLERQPGRLAYLDEK
jgi:hypothetical protein